jgi:FtsH-binding integral membrane protein
LSQVDLYPNQNGIQGIGKLAHPGSGAVTIFSNFISGVIGIMTIIAIIWAIFSIITGAISIISSGGDKQALETARKRIMMGIIGLIIVLVALLIIELVGYFLGLKDILNIQNLFNLVSPGSQGASQPHKVS